MQFTTGKTSYSVARFYDMFQRKLPIVVMVAQGFCGDIVDDTFDREQIMIFSGVSRQSRVVGSFNIGGKTRLMSIPEDYMEKLCIVEKGRVLKEDQLLNILRSHNLPVLVQFPEDRVLTVGNKSINTNHIPPIELAKRFEEVYLLGNTILDGELSEAVIHVPLYLSELRLSVVVGIKGQSSERWRLYLDHLKRKCSGFKYNQHFGNPDIAEYDPSVIHSDTKIAYVQPKSYSSIIGLVQCQPLRNRPILHVPSMERYNRQDLTQGINRPLPPVPSKSRQQLHYKSGDANMSITKSEDGMYLTPISHPKSDMSEREAFVASSGRTSQTHFIDARRTMSAFEARSPNPEPRPFEPKPRPDIPERQPILAYPVVTKQHYIKNPKYTNDLPRSFVPPMVQLKQPHARETLLKSQSGEMNRHYDDTRKSMSVMNVDELSIHEVCEYLKILKLDQYSEKFRDNMIDGTMLVNLTGSMLRDDFGMTGEEALRLLKFAKEGYIPA